MPTESDNVFGLQNTTDAPAGDAPVTPPQYATLDQFNQLTQQNQQLQLLLQTQQQQLQGFFATQQRPADQEPPPPTDDELNKSFADGTLGSKIKDLLTSQERRMEKRILQERSAAEVAIADLTTRISVKELPYYDRFKDEIDRRLSQFGPQAKTNPEVIRFVHNAVVGENVEKISQEKLEKAVRQASAPNPPGGSSSRSNGSNVPKVKTPEELFGQDAMNELQRKGGPEAWARRQGHKDWASYAAFVESSRS